MLLERSFTLISNVVFCSMHLSEFDSPDVRARCQVRQEAGDVLCGGVTTIRAKHCRGVRALMDQELCRRQKQIKL